MTPPGVAVYPEANHPPFGLLTEPAVLIGDRLAHRAEVGEGGGHQAFTLIFGDEAAAGVSSGSGADSVEGFTIMSLPCSCMTAAAMRRFSSDGRADGERGAPVKGTIMSLTTPVCVSRRRVVRVYSKV